MKDVLARRALLRAAVAGATGIGLSVRARTASAQSLNAVSLCPLGAGQDDWPTLASYAAKCAYTAPIILMPGLWTCGSQHALPNGTTIIGTSQTRIVQTLPTGTGDPTMAAFFAQYSPNTLQETALTAAPATGSNQISVLTNVVPIGSYFLVQEQASQFRLRIYKVLAVSGTGPYVLTLDRPVLAGLSYNDQAVGVTPVQDIQILGNGMSMSGTGSRYIELMGARDCMVADVNFDGQAGTVSERLISLDIASFNSHMVSLTGDGGGSAPSGVSFESAEHCSAMACVISGCKTTAYIFEDAQSCTLVECQTTANPASGVIFTGTEGSQGCAIVGGSFTGNTLGVVVEAGSVLTQIVSATVGDNSGVGVVITGNATVADTLIANSLISQNASAGVEIDACGVGTVIVDSTVTANGKGVIVYSGSSGTALRGVDLSANAIALDVGSYCDADMVSAAAPPSTNAIVVVRQNATFRGRGLTLTSGETVNAILAEAGAQLELDGLQLSLGGRSNGVVTNGDGAVISVKNAIIGPANGGTQGIGLFASVGTIRVGASVDASACTTPTYAFGGAYLSLGTVVTNGAEAVSVAWPDLQATDAVALTLLSSGGMPGATPSTIMTPGVGFSIVASPCDRSTYQYRVCQA